jgi:hypothetical protein
MKNSVFSNKLESITWRIVYTKFSEILWLCCIFATFGLKYCDHYPARDCNALIKNIIGVEQTLAKACSFHI